MGYADDSTDKIAKRKKVRVPDIIASKGKKKIIALTCYDATFARLLEKTNVDVVLVGDSLGHTVKGQNSTINVTVSEVAYHTAAVASKLKTSLLVADMPFGTAGFENVLCWEAAQTLIKAGAEAIKIEGATTEICAQINRLVGNGIPVMGHIGLTPQSIHAIGGYKLQGKNDSAKTKLILDAQKLEQAGCFSLVLELVDAETAEAISNSISIPTIGIGAGAHCDGQILVINDMLGLDLSFSPKFLKRFAMLENIVVASVNQYCEEVATSKFPMPEHTNSTKEP